MWTSCSIGSQEGAGFPKRKGKPFTLRFILYFEEKKKKLNQNGNEFIHHDIRSLSFSSPSINAHICLPISTIDISIRAEIVRTFGDHWPSNILSRSCFASVLYRVLHPIPPLWCSRRTWRVKALRERSSSSQIVYSLPSRLGMTFTKLLIASSTDRQQRTARWWEQKRKKRQSQKIKK